MNRRDDLDPMLDRQLGELLRDAVSTVEPEDRLGELRARVSRPPRRTRMLVGLAGAGLAGAAVVTAVAVGPQLLTAAQDDPAADSSVASSPSGSAEESPTATDGSSTPVATRAVAGYYLGDTPVGVRLFREFRSVEAADDGPGASLRLLTAEPADPDYRTAWPAGAFGDAEVGTTEITVELADVSLTQRPTSMSQEEAAASVQQVVYTMQAYAQQPLPVRFTTPDGPTSQVLGTAVDERVAAVSPLQALSHVNLTSPGEGEAVSGRLPVEGVASSFEATVPWTLRDETGEPVDEGFFTAEGWMGDRLFPFRGALDLSSTPAGTYTLVVQTADPSGGTEGPGAYSDTRTVVVE